MLPNRETKFEVDVGDIMAESIPPSKHSAANWPFYEREAGGDENPTTALLEDPEGLTTSLSLLGRAQRKEINKLVRGI